MGGKAAPVIGEVSLGKKNKQLLKCDSDENPLAEKSMTTAEKQRLRIRDDDKSEK